MDTNGVSWKVIPAESFGKPLRQAGGGDRDKPTENPFDLVIVIILRDQWQPGSGRSTPAPDPQTRKTEVRMRMVMPVLINLGRVEIVKT